MKILRMDVQFPYKLEVIIAKSPILDEKKLTLIESLNFSPSLHTDSLFTANDWIFHLKKFKRKKSINNFVNIVAILFTMKKNIKNHITLSLSI